MGTPYRRIIHPVGIDLRVEERPIGSIEGIYYVIAEADTIEVEGFGTDVETHDCYLDRYKTVFDKPPFATGEINTFLDAMLEAIKQDHFIWLHDHVSSKWDDSEHTKNQDEIYYRYVEDLKGRARVDLAFDAIVEVNHLFPGWIYRQSKIVDMIYRQTRMAVQGKSMAKREQAQKWLNAVCVPGTTTGRKLLPFLSRKEMYPLFRIYFDVLKIRKVHALLKPKYSKGSPTLFAANIRNIFPTIAVDDDTLAEIAGYPITKHTNPPSSINVAAKMLGKAVGYNERAIRERKTTHLSDWTRRIGPIKRLARETAAELAEKK